MKSNINKYLNMDFVTAKNTELRTAIKALAKTANQRLRQIESSGKTEQSLAYKWVERQFNDWLESDKTKNTFMSVTSNGELKFNTSVAKMERGKMQQELVRLRDFLTAKTSTVSGTKETVSKAYESFMDNTGVALSEEDFDALWDEPLVQRFFDMYGYSEFHRLTEAVEDYSISPTQVTAILKKAGITENPADTMEKPLKSVMREFEIFKKLRDNDIKSESRGKSFTQYKFKR